MTDKQIIIDGVDVSGCSCHYNGWSQLYRDNRDMCDKGYDLECKPKENGCYHYTKCLEEQLKAKEQKCENYKKQFKADTKEMEDYQNEITRHLESIEYWQHQAEAKEQECEELKKQIMQKSEIDMFFNTPIEGWSSDPCGICKYKNCLTEIKEIAESDNQYLSDGTILRYEVVNKILQKISEVIYE